MGRDSHAGGVVGWGAGRTTVGVRFRIRTRGSHPPFLLEVLLRRDSRLLIFSVRIAISHIVGTLPPISECPPLPGCEFGRLFVIGNVVGERGQERAPIVHLEDVFPKDARSIQIYPKAIRLQSRGVALPEEIDHRHQQFPRRHQIKSRHGLICAE